MISGKVTGLDKLLRTTAKLQKATGLELTNQILDMGLAIQSTAIKSIQAHQSAGVKYGNHVASKEGFPPNSDTGQLVQSIDVQPEKDSVIVGTNLKYGAWLEFGTNNMGARPWLAPAFASAIKPGMKAIIKGLDDEIKKVDGK